MRNSACLSGVILGLTAAAQAQEPRFIQKHLEPAARRIMTEPCRLMVRGASHCSRRSYPRVTGGMMRTWDVQWQGRVSQAEINGLWMEGDMALFYAPPGVQVNGRLPGSTFSGGEDGEFPAPATDFSFTGDVPDGAPLLRAFLSDRAAPPNTPSTTYLQEWTTSAMEASVLVKWAGPQPLQLHVATGRLPLNDFSGELADRQDFDVTVSFSPGVTGRITVPVAAGEGLPAAVVLTRDGFDEAGSRLYYGGTDFRRAAGTFQLDVAAVSGFEIADHLNLYRCTDASLRSWYAANGRPNTFLYLLGHNDEGNGVPPQVFEQRMRALIERDLAAATSPQVGLSAPELRWVLLCPWAYGNLVKDYATVLHHIADNPPAGLQVGQVGSISLYDRFGGVNPIVGGGVHFETEADADLVLGAVWEEFRLACPQCACPADCNGDQELNLADFGCFQTGFALGDPYADCNGDTLLNLADFGCFQTKFALGCR